MYIILQALKKQRGYAAEDFLAAMKEVFVPVTMTSVVNGAMFAIMNVNVRQPQTSFVYESADD